MPYYSYKIALDVLSETDKNHIIALYLSSDLPNVSRISQNLISAPSH